MTVGGHRPLELGSGIDTFENVREFLVAYLEYEQQTRITN